MQGGPAVDHLDATLVEQRVRGARLENARLLIQQIGANTTQELLAHAHVQPLILSLHHSAERAVDERHEGRAHGKIIPRRVRRAGEHDDPPESPSAFDDGRQTVAELHHDLRRASFVDQRILGFRARHRGDRRRVRDGDQIKRAIEPHRRQGASVGIVPDGNNAVLQLAVLQREKIRVLLGVAARRSEGRGQ